ncbi:MAG TPA: aquaporin [Acidimicrobiales bacterium]|nr:aquaporin [Acidimicrobiales bacterium]
MYGPAAAVVAMTYVFGPLSELHVNPAVTPAFAGRRVLEVTWVVPYLVAQMAGAILAALFLQTMCGNVASDGNFPIAKPGGDWRSLVTEIALVPGLPDKEEREAAEGGALPLARWSGSVASGAGTSLWRKHGPRRLCFASRSVLALIGLTSRC